ncbi:anaerobic sulfatase-maturation protein [Arcticibacter sp. MXS-1]|uniref:anaerobic sulfatase-maturation protein n=1 Tax=Arcticibacter sp. MXS-1 TaxID=3341726 RepID=UPI0035A8C313
MAEYPNPGFSLMAKPAGSQCNLSCSYCYYLEKEKLYPGSGQARMNDETLEVFVRKYIHEQPAKEITFVWQGGEPALAGITFYKNALQLQRKYGSGKAIHNSFQTNGTLLNDEWCRFFKDNNFLLGISIDGPEALHDHYRLNRGKEGSFAKTMKGLELLKKHNIEFNTLTVVNKLNAEKPLEVYKFLKEVGSHFMQFIPLADRCAVNKRPDELLLVPPSYPGQATLAPWCASALSTGRFLITVFDEWVKKDVGRYFVQLFDAALANEMGIAPGLCTFNDHCANAAIIEHNGDIYSCDHFAYPQYKIGNVLSGPLNRIFSQTRQMEFAAAKYTTLPHQCKTCSEYVYCRGECPKNRFLTSVDGEYGLNYFCNGYKQFFRHIKPYLKFMKNELLNHRSPANIMHQKIGGFD